MSSDEDSEVILEEGELHKYLQLHGSDLDLGDLYTNRKSCNGIFAGDPLPFFQSKLVSKDIINNINVILNSTLLLEEDAIYLYRKFSELVPEKQYKMDYKVWLPAVIVGISTCGYFCYLKNIWMSLICCSSVTLLWGMKGFYTCFNHTRRMNKLVHSLKETTSYVRKNIKLLQEEDAMLNSKQKLQYLRNSEDIINTFTLRRKRVEIFIILQKLILTLQSLIVVSRKTTLGILNIVNKNLHLNHNTHLALYSDDQLGINKKFEDFDEGMNIFPYVDVLKNIYIMMQSETLRELGLFLIDFPESCEIPKLYELIHQYKLASSVILSDLIKQYQKSFNPIYVPKSKITTNNSTKYLCSMINGISLSLNSLLNESRKLQEFVEETYNESYININRRVGEKLLDLEKEITNLLEYINTSSQVLLKENKCSQESSNFVPLPVEKCTDVGSVIDISELSIPNIDEVYLDYIEGNENHLYVNEYTEEYVKPKHHNILMNELKALLVSKRKDFEQREIKALKSEKEIESYMACTTECDILKNKNELKSSNMKHVNQIVTDSNQHLQLVGGTLSKDVATEAINLLRTWNRKSDEKWFGDESEDSCLESDETDNNSTT